MSPAIAEAGGSSSGVELRDAAITSGTGGGTAACKSARSTTVPGKAGRCTGGLFGGGPNDGGRVSGRHTSGAAFLINPNGKSGNEIFRGVASGQASSSGVEPMVLIMLLRSSGIAGDDASITKCHLQYIAARDTWLQASPNPNLEWYLFTPWSPLRSKVL